MFVSGTPKHYVFSSTVQICTSIWYYHCLVVVQCSFTTGNKYTCQPLLPLQPPHYAPTRAHSISRMPDVDPDTVSLRILRTSDARQFAMAFPRSALISTVAKKVCPCPPSFIHHTLRSSALRLWLFCVVCTCHILLDGGVVSSAVCADKRRRQHVDVGGMQVADTEGSPAQARVRLFFGGRVLLEEHDLRHYNIRSSGS
eukprot:3676247-Rhodomonas_salina.1